MNRRFPNDPSETQILRSITDYLTLRGRFWWRNQGGALPLTDSKGKRRYFRQGLPGLPDLMVILPPDGQLLGLEVKKPSGIVSAAQHSVKGAFLAAGARYEVVRSLEEAQRAIVALSKH